LALNISIALSKKAMLFSTARLADFFPFPEGISVSETRISG